MNDSASATSSNPPKATTNPKRPAVSSPAAQGVQSEEGPVVVVDEETERQVQHFKEKLDSITRGERKLRPNYGADWIEDLRRRL
jgi:hypothetical protein